ncbi:MAG: HD domain-containing protein [Elusimicrobiota bacterium]
MISARNLKSLHKWFDSYAGRYKSRKDKELTNNTLLKQKHTKRVCGLITDIGRTLKLSPADLRLAETTALFHDVGRFEQYVIQRNFADTKHLDHAAGAVSILRRFKVLDCLGACSREIVLKAVKHHNRMLLPKKESGRVLFFSKLLRDADKIDIIDLLINYYMGNTGPGDEEIEVFFPDTPQISRAVTADLLAGRIVKFSKLKTINDFKLYKMGWLLDLNFEGSFEIVRKKRYLEKLLSTLPKKPEVLAVYNYVKSKIQNPNDKI